MNAQVTYVPYLSFDLSICLSFDLSGFENYISQNLSQDLTAPGTAPLDQQQKHNNMPIPNRSKPYTVTL